MSYRNFPRMIEVKLCFKMGCSVTIVCVSRLWSLRQSLLRAAVGVGELRFVSRMPLGADF